MTMTAFQKIFTKKNPYILAPLAGVSDVPFRRICQEKGADLTYVEMLSATALAYDSKRTFEMLARHESESILGVQVTGARVDHMEHAVGILHKFGFDTIDINMGCPVKKVVKTGCGSALMKDPEHAYQIVCAARRATDKPLSVKIRIGFDHEHKNFLEIGDAAQKAGADWLTIHGRTRADDYSVPVDVTAIAALKRYVKIPVIGNGNIFTGQDRTHMREIAQVDGVMVSRGALGNPWIFAPQVAAVTLDDWADVVLRHLRYQYECYGDEPRGVVTMRKHLLWYLKGFYGCRDEKQKLMEAKTIDEAISVVEQVVSHLRAMGAELRQAIRPGSFKGDWDPKYEMDRQHDRGVGDDLLEGGSGTLCEGI